MGEHEIGKEFVMSIVDFIEKKHKEAQSLGELLLCLELLKSINESLHIE